MNVIDKARLIATVAHAAVGQKRKYTGEDYIHHPLEVANLVWHLGDRVVAAAMLHDVLEDTGVPYELLAKELGEGVADLVLEVTDVSTPEMGNRRVRKLADLEHLAMASSEGKSIKLADLISNSKSIVEHDPDFARVYLREKEALLKVLVGGDEDLYGVAVRVLEEGKAKLNIDQGEVK